MRALLVILFLCFSTSLMAQKNKRELRREKREAEALIVANKVEEIVKSKIFTFIPNKFYSGTAQGNSKVFGQDIKGVNNTGLSGYFIEITDQNNVKVYLPYVGKVNTAILDDGSIDFESKSYRVEYAPQKDASDGWLIGLYVTHKEKNIYYEFIMEINKAGECIVDCYITGREPNRYEGTLDI